VELWKNCEKVKQNKEKGINKTMLKLEQYFCSFCLVVLEQFNRRKIIFFNFSGWIWPILFAFLHGRRTDIKQEVSNKHCVP
jgi:hypothetical protein